MSDLDRRQVLQTSAALAAVAVMPGASAAPTSTRLHPCGCANTCPDDEFGGDCLVHDENGRRFDSYTAEEVAAEYGLKVEHQTEETEWSCYCGRHDDDLMPVGTPCVWEKTSYEYDEWECTCLAALRAEWLSAVTTDWSDMARQSYAQASGNGGGNETA